MIDELRPGRVVHASAIKDRLGTERDYVELNFSAGRGKQFVLVLLGLEEKRDDGRKVDAEKALTALGWTPTDALLAYLDKRIEANENVFCDLSDRPTHEDEAKARARIAAYEAVKTWLETGQE